MRYWFPPLSLAVAPRDGSNTCMTSVYERLRRPPWRTIVPAVSLLTFLVLAYLIWSPGVSITDGRHDLHANGIWASHGWIGGDDWFIRNNRDSLLFRTPERLAQLRLLLDEQHIRYFFPHLCPCKDNGDLPSVDHQQLEHLLDALPGIDVIPWIGGVYQEYCFPESAPWRARFISSTCDLFRDHPRLAGVQLNIEPLPCGNPAFLQLLEELRARLPKGKILSVAAYPPPTRWHPYPNVHWDESYFRQVAQRCDLMAVMMYDTGLRLVKPYEKLMADWTEQLLAWSGATPVLLGVPAYDDADSGYHHPEVENVSHALRGIHAGLERLSKRLASYRGIAIYSEWELDAQERDVLQREFLRREPTP